MIKCCNGNCNQGRLCPSKHKLNYAAFFTTGIIVGAFAVVALSYLLNQYLN